MDKKGVLKIITQELIDKINHLARKSKAEGLSQAEKAEQARLRQEYLKGIRAQVTATLNQVKPAPGHAHSSACECGCKGKSIP
ncbi:MAG TPA: DUF896 domain-containing protein [Desulfobacteria bacterium]|nr:DUF896 domain-containing protein [Desulfobacteria bacterium]